jgi:hypothetical protein
MCIDWIGVNVIPMSLVVAWVFDAAKREALFPNGCFGFKPEGEAPFDILHGLLNGDIGCGREEQVEMVWHQDEGVELVTALSAVVVEEVQEQGCVRLGLEKATTIGGDGGNEEGSDFLRCEIHAGEIRPAVCGRKDYASLAGCWRRLDALEREGPRLKPLLFHLLIPWPEGHGFYRRLALRGLCVMRRWWWCPPVRSLFHGLKAMASTVASRCEAYV